MKNSYDVLLRSPRSARAAVALTHARFATTPGKPAARRAALSRLSHRSRSSPCVAMAGRRGRLSENHGMARFVVDSGATLHLAGEGAKVSTKHELLAPTLWRSEALAALYRAVRRGELAAEIA